MFLLFSRQPNNIKSQIKISCLRERKKKKKTTTRLTKSKKTNLFLFSSSETTSVLRFSEIEISTKQEPTVERTKLKCFEFEFVPSDNSKRFFPQKWDGRKIFEIFRENEPTGGKVTRLRERERKMGKETLKNGRMIKFNAGIRETSN